MHWFNLILAVLFTSVQLSIGLKYGYYFTATFNLTTQEPLAVSEILQTLSKASEDRNIECRGTIVNLRNGNRTGDIYYIIYSQENSIGGIFKQLLDISSQLKQIEFYNINVYFAYFLMVDFKLAPTSSVNIQYFSSKQSDYTDNFLANIFIVTTGVNFHIFDPPIPTFNRFFVSLGETDGILKGKLSTIMLSSNNYSNIYPPIYPLNLGNFNITINQAFWDKLSTYSLEGNTIFEYYITGTFNTSFLSFLQSENIIELAYQVFQNISYSFSSFGILFEGEILYINNSTNAVNFHGSLFGENKELREIIYISTLAIPSIPKAVLKNVMIYNIFEATIYAFLDNITYNSSSLLQNQSAFKDNLERKILYGLLKENLILLNGNYYEFGLQAQTIENKIGIFVYFLVFSDQASLFEVQTRILNVFNLLPAISDPFNTKIERLRRQTTENYTEYKVPQSIFNVSTSSYAGNNIKLTTDLTTGLETIPSTLPNTTTYGVTKQSITSDTEPLTNFTSQTTISTKKEVTTDNPTSQFTPITSLYKETSVKLNSTVLINTTRSPNPITSATATQSTSYTSQSQTSSSKKPNTTFSSQSTTTTTKASTTRSVITSSTYYPSGSTIASVDVKCTFNEDYDVAYNDENSEEYKRFTGKRTNELKESFSKNAKLKLESVKYNSITKGSVVVNFTVVTISTTPVSSSQLASGIQDVTTNAFGANATVDKIAVSSMTYVTAPTMMSTDGYPTSPDSWKIAVGVIFAIIGAVLIIFLILHFSGQLTKIVQRFKGYVQKNSECV